MPSFLRQWRNFRSLQTRIEKKVSTYLNMKVDSTLPADQEASFKRKEKPSESGVGCREGNCGDLSLKLHSLRSFVLNIEHSTPNIERMENCKSDVEAL